MATLAPGLGDTISDPNSSIYYFFAALPFAAAALIIVPLFSKGYKKVKKRKKA